MGNPFPRGTRWHRVFQHLLDGLAERQGAADFEALPLDRQRWTWTQAVLHTHRMLDAAEIVGDPSARALNVDRHLAYLNADLRLSQLLGITPNAAESSDPFALAAKVVRDGQVSPIPHSRETQPRPSGTVRKTP